MKSVLSIAALLLSIFTTSVHATEPSDDKAQITQVFAHYMQNYNSYLKTKVMNKAQSLYTDKMMLITPNRTPAVLNEEKLAKGIQAFLDGLRAKGVNNIAWDKLQIKLLSSSVAIASNTAVRYKSNGDIYDRAAATYMLTKNNNQWKIATLAPHAVKNVLPLG